MRVDCGIALTRKVLPIVLGQNRHRVLGCVEQKTVVGAADNRWVSLEDCLRCGGFFGGRMIFDCWCMGLKITRG